MRSASNSNHIWHFPEFQTLLLHFWLGYNKMILNQTPLISQNGQKYCNVREGDSPVKTTITFL
jgi:hypothetical protein